MVRRLLQLTARERCLFIWAYARLVSIDVRLRRSGFSQLADRLARCLSDAERPIHDNDQQRAVERARWLEAASRYHFLQARCLHRALALHEWLSGQRMPSELRIGVRLQGTELQAHAWVELGGLPVSDPIEMVRVFTPLRRVGDNEPAAFGRALAVLGERP